MPAPATVDEFLDLVRKSGVLEETRLKAYVQKLRNDPATPQAPSDVAGLFVRDGLLTYFQAEQFLQGRWKRFTIGKYKVLEKLGSGGMGQVFLCEHKLMRRRVAVKVLPTAKAADPSSLERFYREARAVAALDHVNIVRAYDIDQDDNLHFLVMEYVDGSSLQDMVRKTKRMDVDRACHYMYWSAIGLQHAHAAGLIHRDIKPGNILVDRQGVVKILDLGLARFFNDDEDLLTKKYDESVLGTADYLAPEQAIDSHTVDGRADIYSLGATFYFLLTGQPPFADGTVAQKLLWHQNRMPKPIREVRPEVPDRVAEVLEKMMAKKPEDRYATPAALAEALLPLTQSPIGPPPDEEMPQLSAAAQGTTSGPTSMASAPRTIVTAPRTPLPTTGPGGKNHPAGDTRSLQAQSPSTTAVVEALTQKTRPTPPAPVIEPIPESTPSTPIWEVISAETANASRDDTDRKKRDQSSRRTRVRPSESRETDSDRSDARKKPSGKRASLALILGLIAGLLVIVGGAAAAYWFGFREKPPVNPPPASAQPRTLYLTKNPGTAPNHFTSLQKALEDYRPGDTVIIKDEEWEEHAAATRTKGLVLSAIEGKHVVWRAPAATKGPSDRPLLTLFGVEGGRISGITFDCGGTAATAIRIGGPCPDLVLENLTLSNSTQSCLLFHDCTGADNRPVQVRKCRISNSVGKECRAAVQFTAEAPLRGNRSILISNCFVEGPFGTAAFQFEGSASAVEIRQCRVWNVGHGVWFRKSLSGQPVWQVNLSNNTFHGTTGPTIRFEDINQIRARAETRIVLDRNFFAATPAAVSVEGGELADLKFLICEPNTNGRRTGIPPGNLPIPIAEYEIDLPANPLDRGTFLRYDRSSPLFTGAAGKPVGASPD